MKRPPLFPATLAVLLLLAGSMSAHATWIENGIIISARPSFQWFSRAVPDGAGGTIIAWTDYSGTQDVYAQRVDAQGNALWAASGIPICDASGAQSSSSIVSDGAGGAIIAWEDERDSGTTGVDIYAQRVDADGNVLWGDNGVAICNSGGNQQAPRMADTGAVVVMSWHDRRSGTADIYAQRIAADGSALWTANGVALCTMAGEQTYPHIVSDGGGGAIVAWNDERSGASDIYAQAVNFFGTPAWTTNGVPVAVATGVQISARIIPDAASGAIITWEDARGASLDIYAQRLAASGTPLWTTNGVAVCDGSGLQINPALVSDGAGGAIITWWDQRSDDDIYAQRLTDLGVPLWTYRGVPVSAAPSSQALPEIVSDGAGGAVIAWYDERDDADGDIYAQRISGSGASYWTPDGVPVSQGSGGQTVEALALDSGGVVLSFWDARSQDVNLYAQRVELNHGWWGHPVPAILSAADNPDDQGGQVSLNWQASERDALLYQEISHYSTWRAVDPASAGSLPESDRAVSLAEVGRGFSGASYRDEQSRSGGFLWEFVGTQDAIYASGYSDLVATRQDSTSNSSHLHYFQVVAHTFTPSVFFPSAPDSGYSVDNLAPGAPLMLAAQRSGADVLLDWHGSGEGEPDLGIYAVYRGTAAGVFPDPSFFIDSAVDTTLTDANAPASELYYIVTAVDVHGNEGPASNEAMVDANATGVTGSIALTSLQVLPNLPNPFAGATEIRLGIPAESAVTLEIFDVVGRRVLARSYGRMSVGWQRLLFDGRDTEGRMLPTGVYFYRVNVGAETVTHKMVVTR